MRPLPGPVRLSFNWLSWPLHPGWWTGSPWKCPPCPQLSIISATAHACRWGRCSSSSEGEAQAPHSALRRSGACEPERLQRFKAVCPLAASHSWSLPRGRHGTNQADAFNWWIIDNFIMGWTLFFTIRIKFQWLQNKARIHTTLTCRCVWQHHLCESQLSEAPSCTIPAQKS